MGTSALTFVVGSLEQRGEERGREMTTNAGSDSATTVHCDGAWDVTAQWWSRQSNVYVLYPHTRRPEVTPCYASRASFVLL